MLFRPQPSALESKTTSKDLSSIAFAIIKQALTKDILVGVVGAPSTYKAMLLKSIFGKEFEAVSVLSNTKDNQYSLTVIFSGQQNETALIENVFNVVLVVVSTQREIEKYQALFQSSKKTDQLCFFLIPKNLELSLKSPEEITIVFAGQQNKKEFYSKVGEKIEKLADANNKKRCLLM